jgi:hypothetical protein
LDTLLAGIQALYNLALDGIGKVIEALRKLLEGLGNLVTAAKQMPGHFMGQLSEEVLGMNLTEPLPFERSKEDCAKCDTPATAKGGDATAAKGGDDNAALLNKTKFAEDDFAIDSVAPFDVDPQFVASLNLQEGGEVEFGESNDPANSMEAIKAELGGGKTEGDVPAGALGEGEKAAGGCCDDEQTAEAKLQEMMAQKPEGAEATQKQGKPAQQGDIPANMKTIGPLSVGQRAKYMSNQMIQGVKQWFSANWPKLLAGAIAALAAFVGLNILTGGAITAALPAIMQVVGVVMGGVALANIAGHVGDYLSKGWAGDIAGGAKSLARGLAAGAVELVFALLFSAGAVIKAVKGGLKGTAKAAKGAVKNTVKTTVKSVKELGQIGAKGAKTALKNGKIMLDGVKGGFAKGAKSLDDLARRLGNKLRFNKFKIRRQGLRIKLLGHINPWIVIADGEIKTEGVTKDTPGAIHLTDEQLSVFRNHLSNDALQALNKLRQDEVDQLVNLIRQEPRNADDILRQYFYKGRKLERKQGIPYEGIEDVGSKLQNNLENFEAVKQQGHPYGFNNVDEFKTFQSELKSALGRYDIPIDDIRVHGSAVNKKTPADLDVAILVDEAKFQELGEQFIRNADTTKRERDIRRAVQKGKIPSYYFGPGQPPSVGTSMYGKAGNLELQTSLICKGSEFDLGPYLPF